MWGRASRSVLATVLLSDLPKYRVLRDELSSRRLIIPGIQQVADNACINFNVFLVCKLGCTERVPHSF